MADMNTPVSPDIQGAAEPNLYPDKTQEPDLYPQETVAAPSPYSEDQKHTTALLAALAQKWNYDSGQTLNSLVEINKERLNTGQEPQLRGEISDTAKLDKLKTLHDLQVERLRNAGVGGPSLKDLMDREITVRGEPVDHDALEKDGVANMQAMSAEDPHQASVMGSHPDSLEVARIAATRDVIFNRKRDIHEQELQAQGLPADLLDLLVLPFQSYLAQTSADPGVSTLMQLLPGDNLGQIVSDLEKYDVDNGDYGRALDEVWPRIMAASGVLSTNRPLALQVFSRLRPFASSADQMAANFQMGLDAASLVPLAAAAKLARKPYNLLLKVGARSQAAKVSATTIIKDAQDLGDAAAGGLGKVTEANSGAFEASLPSYVKPNTMDLVTPHVGIAGDVAKEIDAFHEGAAEAIVNMQRGAAPLEQDQLQAAISNAIETSELRFAREGEDIVDIHNVIPEPKWSISAHALQDEHDREMQWLYDKATYTLNEKYSTRLEVDKSATNRLTKTGATERTYNIMQQNRPAGQVQLRYTPHNKNIFVQWVGKNIDKADGASAGDLLERLPMGPKNMRLLLNQLAKEFPNAETVSGLRSSGARTAGGGDAARTSVSLKPYKPKPMDITPAAEGHIPSSLKKPPVAYELGENDLGVIQLHFHLGKKVGGGGYANQKVAELAAVRRGFDLKDVKIIESNLQHFIRVTHDVPETGVAFPALKHTDMPNVNTITQWLKNPQNAIPSMMNDARLMSTLERGNIEANIYRPLFKVIQRLGGKQVRRVTEMVTLSQSEKKWFNVDEFATKYFNQYGKYPTQNELAGYYAYKEIYDANHSLMNNYLYVDNARKGFMTASVENPVTGFKLPRQNMRQIDEPDFKKLRIYDVENDKTLHPGDTVSHQKAQAEIQARYQSGNYRVFELQEHTMKDGDPVKYVMANKRGSTVGPLERRQRRYMPGGESEGRNKWQVKQSVRGKFKGTQSDYVLNPLVHIGERTFTRASEWAAKMEEARLAFNGEGKYTLANQLERRTVVESSSGESWEKWQQQINQGRIRADTPFETLWDRALPADMDRLKADTFDWTPKDTSSASSYFLSNGEYHWQAPREKLLDSEGAAARVLDPMKSVGRAANNAISTAAFADYNRKVIEEWSRVADPFINETSIGFNHDPYHVFFHGDFNEQLLAKDHKLYGQLEGQRLIHKRFLNMRTDKMSLRELANRKITAFVEGKGAAGDWVATRMYDARSKNPIDAIQGFVFDSYLGFYDPGQFFVQIQTAFAAQLTHPVFGAKSVAMNLPMTHLLLNYSDNLLDMYAKSLKLVHGLPTDEFKAMVKTLRNSGWMKVQGSTLQFDYLTNRLGGSALGRGMKAFRQGGRYLFNLSERFNRMTAYQIAWNVVKKENPELHFSSAEFHSLLRQKTDDLTQNMTFASKTGWQKGLAGVPTKFMAYNVHMLESLLPKTFGGNPRMSGAAKTRLGLGQLFLYGTGGAGFLGLTNYIMDAYENATGGKITAEVHRGITKGFFDTLINSWSGGPGMFGSHELAKNPGVLETDYSSRIGVGAGIAQWMQKMFSGDLASAMDVLGGPTGTEGTNLARALGRIVQYVQSEQVTQLTSKDWELLSYDMFSSLKSVSRVTKSYAIWKAGYLHDPKTGAPFVQAGELDHWAAFLGIPLAKETEYWNEFKDENNRKTIVRDFANQVAYRRRKAIDVLQTEGVDSKEALEWEKAVNTITNLFRDDPNMTRDVLRMTNQILDFNENNYDTMIDNMEKATGHRSREGAN